MWIKQCYINIQTFFFQNTSPLELTPPNFPLTAHAHTKSYNEIKKKIFPPML